MKKFKVSIHWLPIVLIYISVISIYYNLYSNTLDVIRSEYKITSDLIEQSIYNETRYTEIMSQIVEKDVNRRMEEYSRVLVEKYNKDKDVTNWDLEELKKQFEYMDIYIINRDIEVINSTIKKEIGLNFDNYFNFKTVLKKRLDGNEFKTDKINFSILEKELRKYSYMPTPDNKYLLELSISINKRYPEMNNLNIVYLSKNLTKQYPFVEDIRVYRYNEDKENSRKLDTSQDNRLKDKSIELNKKEDKYVKKALETNKVQEQIIKDKDNNTYTFKYIPYTVSYENDELLWWGSYVIEVLYKDQVMIDEIDNQRSLFIKSMVAISILYFTFSFLITHLIQKNKKIAYQDHLTKLPNRKKFEEILDIKMKEALRKDNKLVVLFFDLDKFKRINDILGHNVGDKVLQEVAKKIKNATPTRDIASRLGGDEFISLVSHIETEEDIEKVGIKMAKLFDTPLNIDGKQITMKPSIGISIYPDHGETAEELIVKADSAMYKSKEAHIRYKIYDEDDIKK